MNTCQNTCQVIQSICSLSNIIIDQQNVDRLEHAVGWYHSHPGYGCWLSGIDVSTQKLHQKFEGLL